ncbi:MAG: hypothetical protein JO232_06360 [Verrucomicrobia bacterium]|nr:hypothetical protein [Verrucomicrobiota bacterium]
MSALLTQYHNMSNDMLLYYPFSWSERAPWYVLPFHRTPRPAVWRKLFNAIANANEYPTGWRATLNQEVLYRRAADIRML